jgi:hypothetical protein
LVTFNTNGKNQHNTHTHTHIKLHFSLNVLVLTNVEQCHVSLNMQDTPEKNSHIKTPYATLKHKHNIKVPQSTHPLSPAPFVLALSSDQTAAKTIIVSAMLN